MKPLVESNDVLEDAAGLQARAAEHGYLFFRGLVDPMQIMDLRFDFCRILAALGWLDEGVILRPIHG